MKGKRHDPDLIRRAGSLARTTGRSFGDIARETGVAASTVAGWSRRFGWRPLSGRDIGVALRGHVARQIARFDAALEDGSAGPDSAKVLRDLGGLKRLLDEIDADERTKGAGDGDPGGDGLGDPDLDLPALRAQIARRYAAFAGERADAGLPGEPAAGPDPGAGP